MSLLAPGTSRNLVAAAPALGLYVAACVVPALFFWNTQTQQLQTVLGAQALLMGPLAVLAGQFGWLANPLWALALATFLTGRPRSAAVLAVLSAGVAAHTFRLYGHPLPANEGGEGELQLRALGPGFYLWGISALALTFGALIRALGKRPPSSGA